MMAINIGEKLKELRIAKGMNQDELATALEVSRSTIGMYEQGMREPALDMLLKYCKFFDVDMNFLCSIQESAGDEQEQRIYPALPTFADRLRYIMDERDMTLADVSQQTGINKGTISKYLSGGYAPKYETTRKIAVSLGSNVHWLLGESILPSGCTENLPEQCKHDIPSEQVSEQCEPETPPENAPDPKDIRLKLIAAITAMPDEDILFLKRILDTKL